MLVAMTGQTFTTNNNIANFYRAPLCQSHRGASATAKVYNVTYTARDRITPKLCTYRQWGNAVRGIQTSILLERHLTNEFLFKFSVVLPGIYIAAPTGVPPAADTDSRLAQPVTPESVYSPTPAERRSTPRNLILCLARAGIEPTTSSTVVQRLTTVPTRQACV